MRRVGAGGQEVACCKGLPSHDPAPNRKCVAMTIMLAKVYAALKAAGAPEDEAMAAAEEMGTMRDEFGGFRTAMHEMHTDMKTELSGLRGDFRSGFGDLRSDMNQMRSDFHGELAGVRSEIAYMRGRFDVLIWAVGINAAATVAILGVLLRH